MNTVSQQITATARAFECILGNNLAYAQIVNARTVYMRKIEDHRRKACNPRARQLLTEALQDVTTSRTVELALEAGRAEA